MAVQYRAVRDSEDREVMDLWTGVFDPTPEWYFRAELNAETTRKPHQTLIALDGGKIVAAVQYFIRKTRALDGSVKKMGGIGNVATLPEARKQGHSGKLLEMSIEKMAKDGCEWSMLYTGVNPHYERYGWRTVKTRYREGSLADRFEFDNRWTILPVNPSDEPDWWKPFARIYEAFNEKRALTHVRDEAYWKLAAGPKLEHWGHVAYLAWPQDCREAVAYAIAQTDDKRLGLTEVGYLPGQEAALEPMMDVVRELAVHRKVSKIVAHVPFDKAVNAALHRLMKAPKIVIDTSVMVRSLSAKFPQEEVEKPFSMDGPNAWPLDGF